MPGKRASRAVTASTESRINREEIEPFWKNREDEKTRATASRPKKEIRIEKGTSGRRKGTGRGGRTSFPMEEREKVGTAGDVGLHT